MKYFKLIGIMSLVVFSFYLTDFVTNLAVLSNPLMKLIEENKDKYYVESVNATINDNTIIPGIKGKKINEMESFLNMKDFKVFNTNYLIYEDIAPDISIEKNKDKIIISGNKSIRQISILTGNNDISKYLETQSIKYTKLIKNIDDLTNKENININSDKSLYKDLDTLLNKKKKNVNICILSYSNIDICKNKKYYIVKPSLEINNNNIITVLRQINKGDIILLDNNLTLENLKILLNRIKNNDLNIVYLSEIIKE